MKGFLIGVMVVFLAGAVQLPLAAQYGSMTLSAGRVTGKTGAAICVNVNATAFRKIVSMQYSIKWDSNVLEFTGVRNFRLPGLSQENYGFQKTKEGTLTFAWLDNSLKGVDLPDGTPIYQLCFKLKGKAGSFSAISFVPKPTPFEVINTYEQFIQLVGVQGKVTIN